MAKISIQNTKTSINGDDYYLKKLLFIPVIFIISCGMAFAGVPHNYFIGETGVKESVWNSIPDSIKQRCSYGIWDNDTLIIERLDLPIEYRLISSGDSTYIVERPAEEVMAIKSQLHDLLSERADEEIRLKAGDSVPSFSVMTFPDGRIMETAVDPGKCYLISFWATWCGNCLLELLPSELPHLAGKFKDDRDFVFMLICIDSSTAELETFFASGHGKRWNHLRQATTLDIDRAANSLFAKSGHLPLNVVIGKDGKVEFIHIGRISTADQFNAIEAAIAKGLSRQEKPH